MVGEMMKNPKILKFVSAYLKTKIKKCVNLQSKNFLLRNKICL